MLELQKILLVMISLRVFSSMIELFAAFLMFHFKNVESAIKINAILGCVGPIIFVLVTFLGIIDLSPQLSFKNMFLILTGVILILLGTR